MQVTLIILAIAQNLFILSKGLVFTALAQLIVALG